MTFNRFYFLKEAFQEKNMQKALALIKAYLEKNLGVKLYQQFGIDHFKNSSGSGDGIKYYLPDDRAIRFNFNGNSITSVDIWRADDNNSFIHIDTRNISVVNILPFVLKQLQSPSIGVYDVNIESEEKTSIKTEANDPKGGVVKQVKVIKVGNEVNNDPDIPKLEKKFNSIEYADPKFVFDDLNSLLGLVAEGKIYSLLITGLPGTGKTYTATKKLDEYGEEGKFYVHMKGVASPMGLYRILYENNGKVIIFDDCDKILKSDTSIAILKAALDNKKERKLTWASPKTYNPDEMPEEQIESLTADGALPNKFVFTGRIIFITNLYQNDIDDAIRSRSYHIDVTLRQKDVVVRIRQILDEIQPDVDRKYKEELLNFIDKNIKTMKSDIDIRKFDNAVRIVASGNPNWQRLVQNNVF